MIEIREYNAGDEEQIWRIIEAVIARGDTYVFAPDAPREKMLAYWLGADKKTYVAVAKTPTADPDETEADSEAQIIGTFYLKANQPDLGSHVANAGYMVAPEAAGKGVGRQMAEFSLAEAGRLGYRAMQFNFVVKSNKVAVRLWQKLGFEIIGEIPEAFRHSEKGLTSALVMYRRL